MKPPSFQLHRQQTLQSSLIPLCLHTPYPVLQEIVSFIFKVHIEPTHFPLPLWPHPGPTHISLVFAWTTKQPPHRLPTLSSPFPTRSQRRPVNTRVRPSPSLFCPEPSPPPLSLHSENVKIKERSKGAEVSPALAQPRPDQPLKGVRLPWH